MISVVHFPKIRLAQFGASFKESWQIFAIEYRPSTVTIGTFPVHVLQKSNSDRRCGLLIHCRVMEEKNDKPGPGEDVSRPYIHMTYLGMF